jgi:hypothetical protein
MIQTAQTMTSLPEGTRPEEFLRDEDLAAFRERELAAADPEAPGYAELRQAARLARRAARMTALAIAEAADDAAQGGE